MRIGMDASAVLVEAKTGVERYVSELLGALAQRLADEPGAELYAYLHAGSAYAEPALLAEVQAALPNVIWRVHAPSRGFGVALPVMAWRDGLDVLHCPMQRLPRRLVCPTVATVHDVAWRHGDPDDNSVERQQGQLGSGPTALRSVAAVIAVSADTALDAADYYGLPPERIHVVHHGINPRFRPVPDAVERVRATYGAVGYILYVGALQSRKNLVRLLQAYAQLQAAGSHDVPLLLAGRDGWGAEDVYAECRRLGLAEAVRFLGYVPDVDLPALYSAAAVVAYPSLHEGFGFPPLEAMACGAVVAASSAGALPEVVGDAALSFAPTSVPEMAMALHSALTEGALRERLRAAGLERARHFTWARAAEETLAVYRIVATSARRVAA